MFRAPLLTRPPPFEAVGAPIMAPKAPSVPSHSFQNSFIKLKTAQATGSWRFDPSPKPPPPPGEPSRAGFAVSTLTRLA